MNWLIAVVLFTTGFSNYPVGPRWVDGSTHGDWTAVYNGYGTTGIHQDTYGNALSLSPKAATSPEETHAGLVTTTRTFADLDLTVKAKTGRQFRADPNPWEVAWVFVGYTDDDHFYSLLLKPNGWELGKEDPAYPGSQRYLKTGSTPTFPVGVWHTYRIRQIGATIAVWGDGQLLTTMTDTKRPYLSGHVGLYTEDAHAHFDDLTITQP